VKSEERKNDRSRQSKGTKKSIDKISESTEIADKKKRGRKRKIPWDWVVGRAPNYEFQLRAVWEKLVPRLLNAKTEADVVAAFVEFGGPYDGEFVPRLSSDILALLNDPDFPKRAEPRIKFMARSLAGRPSIAFRTSRDICEKAAIRQELKSPNKIIRREYYVECSCGYKGPALDNACRKCGAQSLPSIYEWTGRAPSSNEE
jgi:hypothetical protein